MDRATRKLMIISLRSRVAALQIACNAFSKQFERETLSKDEKLTIAHQWDATLKEWKSLRFVLAQLENDELARAGYPLGDLRVAPYSHVSAATSHTERAR
ncbi:MAG TPA: hypothetical protein VMT38_00750 [Terracidiphilus sp.]|nr:hypothetical protein [Terracidiphilus sp.]